MTPRSRRGRPRRYGKAIREARLSRRNPISQTKLADAAGITNSLLCRIETGDIQKPRARTRQRIEKALRRLGAKVAA